MSLWTSRFGEFQHEALFYTCQEDFVSEIADFVADGLVRGEPAVVALSGYKLDVLRDVLGGNQDGVRFLDMDIVGANPVRLIPAYRALLAELAGDGLCRGVGEPVGPHRRGPEMAECQIHESLCNLAFADSRWWVICPYDTTKLEAAVLEEARRSHPWVVENKVRHGSPIYKDITSTDRPLGTPLDAIPAGGVRVIDLGEQGPDIRAMVLKQLFELAGNLGPSRADNLARAVEQLVLNADGRDSDGRVVRLWHAGDAVVANLHLPERITDPLVGRATAITATERAFQAANELCDLVQVRSDGQSTTVRLHTYT